MKHPLRIAIQHPCRPSCGLLNVALQRLPEIASQVRADAAA
jgi:hypothetical protein